MPLVALGLAAATVEHKTKFDAEMLPGVRGAAVTFPLSNSRQLVRTAAGDWLLAFDVPGEGLYLTSAARDVRQGSEFAPPILAVGDEKPGALAQGSKPAGASLVIDGGTAHLAWSDARGVWLATLALPNQAARRMAEIMLRNAAPPKLVAPGGALGDIAIDPERNLVLAWSSSAGVFAGAAGSAHQVAGAGAEPVLSFSRSGRLHLAYRHQKETPFFGKMALDPRIMHTVRENGAWKAPEVAALGLSFVPAIATSGERAVIAFQHEGLKRVRAGSGKYLEDREGGGASIGYAAQSDGGWASGFISRAEEILVRDGSVADGSVGRLYPMVEQKWRPRMAVDKHGVPWVFWPDTTRRHTYFARWLGSGFSDPYECRGAYYAPGEHITVEKHMPGDAAEIGFAYAAAGRLFFGATPVPQLSTTDRRHVLFLDMLEIAETKGVGQRLNHFAKYPRNPVFKPSEPRDWDDYGVTFPNVRLHDGKFTMEYFGHGAGGAAGRWQNGYAESKDGVSWTRPKLGLLEFNGSRDNNLVPWVSNFIDAQEPDPGKRFKGVLIEGHWITNFKRPIAYSPDGIHWRYGEDTVNLTPLLEGNGPSFRDELDIPERRFKAVGRTISQNHRSLGMMWSADLIRWHGDEAVLDVEDPYGKPAMQWRGRYVARTILDPSGDKAGDQIYWGTVWIENGVYLCLYAPYRYDGGYQGALAMSRDGLNYVRIRNGEFILPRGPAGAWDSGFIAVGYGNNAPLRVGDRMRIYYGGVTSHHGTDPWRASAAVGMAELPFDGWAFVSPELATDHGSVTTIPIHVPPGSRARVSLNADIPAGSGSIEVEVLDSATGTPLAGRSRADCDLLRGVRGEAAVRWRGSDRLTTAEASTVRLRFHLNGANTRLYSFWFH
jgi:hypothetical protein